MSHNPDDNTDPRNMMRSCPHCNLVWIKVEGCDGATTCGNRTKSYFDSSAAKTMRPFIKWVINFDNRVATFIKSTPVISDLVSTLETSGNT